MLCAHGPAGNRHALQNPVRVALENAAVHEGAGIAFVGVANDISDRRKLPRDEFPLQTGGVARSTAAAQPALLDLGDNLCRRHLRRRAQQRLISAHGDVIGDAFGIDLAGIRQDDAPLTGKERMVGFDDSPREVTPVSAYERGAVFGLDLGVDDVRRRTTNQRPPAAQSHAAGSADLDFPCLSLSIHLLLKGCTNCLRTGREATRHGATQEAIFQPPLALLLSLA